MFTTGTFHEFAPSHKKHFMDLPHPTNKCEHFMNLLHPTKKHEYFSTGYYYTTTTPEL